MTVARLIRFFLLSTFNITAVDLALAQETDVYGVVRERLTINSAPGFSNDDEFRGLSWSQRLTLGYRTAVNDQLSAHGVLISAVQKGARSSVIQQNHLDVDQLHIDLTTRYTRTRVGRQKFILGSQRLIGNREGPNVPRRWDGISSELRFQSGMLRLFALQVVAPEINGSFNDKADAGNQLVGAHYTLRDAWDIYYLHSRIDDREKVAGIADQVRHSVGVRAFSEKRQWFWNWEAIYQFGHHGELDIYAWTLATNTGYRSIGELDTDFMLSINIASGDDDVTDGKLNTFDALYPRGTYFSELAALGPANFINLNPHVIWRPQTALSVELDVNFFWRHKEADGVFGPGGNLVRAPSGSTERFVSAAVSLAVDWQIDEHVLFGIAATRFEPQKFLEQTGSSDSVSFIELTLSLTL